MCDMQCNQSQGIKLCKLIHEKLVELGYYPALTGGLLYKDGMRKDIDVVIFRNRQMHNHFEMTDIFDLLGDVGLYDFQFYGFVTKAKWEGLTVDLFNPESLYGTDGYGCGEE